MRVADAPTRLGRATAKLRVWIGAGFLELLSPGAIAEERIERYDSEVTIQRDGSLDVLETITVSAEGQNIRRGIYRDFPTRYLDRFGNRVVVLFDVVSVDRNGAPESWFTEQLDNGVRVNTGNDDFLEVPATYTYRLRYHTNRQLGFFDAHDELYWNAIGTGWSFPIDAATIEVRLPEPVPAKDLRLDGYSGYEGAKKKDFSVTVVAPGHVRWQLDKELESYEGLTIVLGFPKGIVEAPTRSQKVYWLLRDNRGLLVAIAAWFALLAFCVMRWGAVGRDPETGTIFPRYEPPAGFTPGALRYIRQMREDQRMFTADVLDLAVRGQITIKRKKRRRTEDWSLDRLDADQDSLPDVYRGMLLNLFSSRSELKLDESNAEALQATIQAQQRVFEQAYRGKMFNRHGGSVGVAVVIAVLGLLTVTATTAGGAGDAVLALTAVVMLVTILQFRKLIVAPTQAGRKLLDEIEGLRLYLSVAEREDLARLAGPESEPRLDAGHFESLLPYAVALDVEEAWTKKFTAAVGVAAAVEATQNIDWYRGGAMDNIDSLTRAVSSSLDQQIASSSSPPGSSSGSDSGGSSGGGGGGGGGGGR